MTRPNYPPLTRRHQRIFAIAALVAVLFSAGLALGRLALIRWWMGNCMGLEPTSQCQLTEAGFNWWWILLAAGVLGIAYVAHRLTADRLVVE